MVPLWFTLSALCFVGAAVLLYVDIDRRRGLGRRRKSWAKSHGFDYEHESRRPHPALEARRHVDRRRHQRQERRARSDPRRGGVHLRPRGRRDRDRAAPQGRHERRRRPAAQGHQGAARERHLAARRDRPADGVLHQPRRRQARLRPADGDVRPHRARTAPRSCGTSRTGRWSACRSPAPGPSGTRACAPCASSTTCSRVLPPIPQTGVGAARAASPPAAPLARPPAQAGPAAAARAARDAAGRPTPAGAATTYRRERSQPTAATAAQRPPVAALSALSNLSACRAPSL